VLVGSLVLLSLVLRVPGYLHQIFDPDEAAIAVQGMGLVEGGHLYTDVIDRKPPLAPWLYAESFRVTHSSDLRPMRLVLALELAAAAVLLAWDLWRRAGPRAAWWGSTLFLLGMTAMAPQDAQSANFSPLAILPGVAAIVLARRGSLRSAIGAGVCVGLATLTRQSWAIGVVPACLAVWWTADNRREGIDPPPRADGERFDRWVLRTVRGAGAPPAIRSAAVFVAALLTVAAVGLTLPLGLFVRWVFTGNGSLLFGLSESRGVAGRALGSLALFVVGHLVLCVLLARRRWDRADLDLWCWLAVGLLSVVAGLRFFGHYWVQVLPPLCLLAAPAIGGFSARWRAWLAGVAALTAVVFFGLALVPERVHHFPSTAVAARIIDANTVPHDRVAIWGSFPELYWASDRLPAGGLILTDFVVGKSAGRIEGPRTIRDAAPDIIHDYVGQLEANPPRIFVDTSAAGLRGYGRYPVSVLPALEHLLKTRYEPIAVVDHMVIYRYVGSPDRP